MTNPFPVLLCLDIGWIALVLYPTMLHSVFYAMQYSERPGPAPNDVCITSRHFNTRKLTSRGHRLDFPFLNKRREFRCGGHCAALQVQ